MHKGFALCALILQQVLPACWMISPCLAASIKTCSSQFMPPAGHRQRQQARPKGRWWAMAETQRPPFPLENDPIYPLKPPPHTLAHCCPSKSLVPVSPLLLELSVDRKKKMVAVGSRNSWQGRLTARKGRPRSESHGKSLSAWDSGWHGAACIRGCRSPVLRAEGTTLGCHC